MLEGNETMKKKIYLLATLAMALFILAGCNEESQEEMDSDLLQIYTSVYPLQFFTEQIGDEFVVVKTIYPPGADEHTFEPSQKDMIKLAESDLFIFVGLGLEGFVEKAKDVLQNENVTLLAAGEKLHLEEGHNEHEVHEHEEHDHDGHSHGDIDPHVWIDPQYAKGLALAITEELSALIPEQKETFEKNFSVLAKQLDEIDTRFKELAANKKHHEFIVAHSAYQYWEKRYGIEQVAISGFSTSDEPSQKKLQNLVDHAKEKGLKYVLYEQNYQSRFAETIQNEIGAEALTLHNLAVLTEDDIKNNETYFSLMDKNLETLAKALNE